MLDTWKASLPVPEGVPTLAGIIHADKIYRTRLNMRFCKKHGIRFSGQKLGRPFEDTALLKAMKKQWREDEQIRNAVEGKFGEGKRKYDIYRIMAKQKETG